MVIALHDGQPYSRVLVNGRVKRHCHRAATMRRLGETMRKKRGVRVGGWASTRWSRAGGISANWAAGHHLLAGCGRSSSVFLRLAAHSSRYTLLLTPPLHVDDQGFSSSPGTPMRTVPSKLSLMLPSDAGTRPVRLVSSHQTCRFPPANASSVPKISFVAFWKINPPWLE